MTVEMMEALLEEMEGTAYDTLTAEFSARMEARWDGDAKAEQAHEARVVAVLAEYGATLADYEHYLGYDEEEDWSDPDWDE